MQPSCNFLIGTGRAPGMRAQRNAFELPGAVRLLDLHARGIVAVRKDDDAGIGAKVQVPELMTGG